MRKLPQWTTVFVAFLLGLSVAFGVGVLSPARLVSGQTNPDGEPDILHEVYQKVNPSVPSITVRIPSQNLSQDQSQQLGPDAAQPYAFAAGSGFVYDNAEHVVTNAHVVQGADQVELTFSDGNILRAKVVGIDLDSDLAVLQAQGNLSKYAPVPLADSDQVQVGDRAIAIGNPFEKAGTMTQGIVSGLHRSVTGLTPATNAGTYTIPDALQTDAALNPGNSGGPLLNSNGQVIGINEQIASQVQQSSGVSFAIPSNLVKLVIPVLLQSGKITHSYLGVSSVSLDLDMNQQLNLPAETRGAYVLNVASGSPAANAGIKGADRNGAGGDVIVAVDKQPITSFDDVTSYLFYHTQPGQTITLTVLRGGQQQDIPVTLGARPQTNP